MKTGDWRPTAFVETAPGLVGDAEDDAAGHDRRAGAAALLRLLLALDALGLAGAVAGLERGIASAAHRQAFGVAIAAFFAGALVAGLASLPLLADAARRRGGRGWFDTGATALSCVAFLTGLGAVAWPSLLAAFR